MHPLTRSWALPSERNLLRASAKHKNFGERLGYIEAKETCEPEYADYE